MDQNSLGHCVIPWVMKEIRGEAEGNLGGGGGVSRNQQADHFCPSLRLIEDEIHKQQQQKMFSIWTVKYGRIFVVTEKFATHCCCFGVQFLRLLFIRNRSLKETNRKTNSKL